MDTDIAADECGSTWHFTPAEQVELQANGVSAWVASSVEHDCILEPGHDGTHVCYCGVSS